MAETRQVRRAGLRKGGWQQAALKAREIAAKRKVPQGRTLSIEQLVLLKGAQDKLDRALKRRKVRAFKRNLKDEQYRKHGLNGPRAVARRRRQIEAGQLQVAA